MRGYLKKNKSLVSRKNANQRGALFVEFSLVIPILMFFAFSAIELLFATYKLMSLQYLANFGLRQLIIAPADDTVTNQEHTSNIQNSIVTQALKLGINLNSQQISVCPVSDPNCGVATPARWNEIMLVKIDIPFNFFKMQLTTLKGVSVGRTEPR